MNQAILTSYFQEDQSIIRSAAFAYLGQRSHLLPAGVDALTVAENFATLTEDQQRRLDQQQPVSHLPLIWVALAQAAGLTVDLPSGRIVDGPKAVLP